MSEPLNSGKHSYNQKIVLVCDQCGVLFHPKTSREKTSRFCSRKCSAKSIGYTMETAAEMLKMHTKKVGSCLIWLGPHNNWGYGQITVDGKTYRTHRLAYLLLNGKDPGDRDVLHTCDMPPCINPDHLFLGDPALNAHDMLSKGRQRGGKNAPGMGTGTAKSAFWKNKIHGLIQG